MAMASVLPFRAERSRISLPCASAQNGDQDRDLWQQLGCMYQADTDPIITERLSQFITEPIRAPSLFLVVGQTCFLVQV